MNAIQLEHVGKRYWLEHRQPDRRLMEVIHGWGRSAGELLTGRRPLRAPRGEEFWALKDVSLEIKQGEIVALIGRNGAGKSTLLKLISWIMAPTTGRLGVRGRMGVLLEVGSGFHPELTGRENIFLNGTILGMSLKQIRQKFDAIVAFAEVEAFLDTPVKHYSSGMFMRLAFSVATTLEPEILIIDEVLSVGDANFQKKCLTVIQDIVRRGTTCLMVSHHMPSVSSLCQRAIFLQSGQVAADGAPENVIRQYLAETPHDAAEVIWPESAEAPGDSEVRLRSVKLFRAAGGEPTADFFDRDEIRVEIIYQRSQPGEELISQVSLRDEGGTTIFVSPSQRPMLSREAAESACQSAGEYRSSCWIPAHLLNEGRYRISIQVGRGIHQPAAVVEDCLTFFVRGGDEFRHLPGGWPGVIRPNLNWRTEPV